MRPVIYFVMVLAGLLAVLVARIGARSEGLSNIIDDDAALLRDALLEGDTLMGWTADALLEGAHLLPLACALGDREGAVALLRASLRTLNVATAAGQTCLSLAIEFGHTELAGMLLRVPEIDVTAATTGGHWTPLHVAAHVGADEALVATLLARGADVGALAQDGSTPLHVAALTGRISARLLTASGSLLEAKAGGQTPLMRACAAGKEAAVRALVVVYSARQPDAMRGMASACVEAAPSSAHAALSGALADYLPSPALLPTDEECAARRILHAARHPFKGAPPKDMPADLARAYTRCGAASVASMFIDDSRGGEGTHYRYGQADIEKMINGAKLLSGNPRPASMGARGWLAQALADNAAVVRGARCVVFGSMQPIVETLLLAYGAANVTTVEYNKLTYSHPRLQTVTLDEVASAEGQAAHMGAYDIALSISSFDHDGLGRYGDPLGPDADLLATDGVRDWLDARGPGLLFLTVPVGPDVIAWNLLRRYGRTRLPLLLSADNLEAFSLPPLRHAPSWHVNGTAGWDGGANKLDAAVDFRRSYEPVWVLKALRMN